MMQPLQLNHFNPVKQLPTLPTHDSKDTRSATRQVQLQLLRHPLMINQICQSIQIYQIISHHIEFPIDYYKMQTDSSTKPPNASRKSQDATT